MTPRHRSRYQERDRLVVDYNEYDFDGGLRFRGPDPRPLTKGTIAFIGAAQTFGCFVEEPFPARLGRELDAPVANFGWGGAGPRFYADSALMAESLNRCGAVVVQVMSSRSEDNDVFESGGLEFLRRRSDGAEFSALDAWQSIIGGYKAGKPPSHRLVKAARRRIGRRRADHLVAQTRSNWVKSYRDLFAKLTVPTVLVWMSTREPDYQHDFTSLSRTFGAFPQLVNRAMFDDVSQLADMTVKVVSDAGLPQPLFHRETGEPVTVDPADDRPDLGGDIWTHNRYYPSPEMHDLAAEVLAGSLASLLGRRR